MGEIIFQITKDETEGGFVAQALGHSIVTRAVTWEFLRDLFVPAAGNYEGEL